MIKNILVIASSARAAEAFSNQLGKAVVEKLKSKNPGAEVKIHDLAKNPTPHLEESHLAAFFAPPEKHTPENKAAVRHSEESIAELMKADVIVIGVPMYNFSIPSALKAWIDHICRAGHTFKYGPNGPEGQVKGKKVYLAIASGGVYTEGPYKPYDFTEPYLRTVLGFLGMTDVTTFRVEGTSVPGAKESALKKGIDSIII